MGGSPLKQPETPVPLTQLARERWKYSRLSAFEEAVKPSQDAQDAMTLSGVDTLDALTAAESRTLLERLRPDTGDYPLLATVDRDAGQMHALRVARQQNATIDLVRVAGTSACLIDIAPDAQTNATLRIDAAEASHGTLYVRVGAGSHLQLTTRIIDQAALSWTYLGIDLAEGASLVLNQQLIGIGQHRFETRLRFLAGNARATVRGAALAAHGARFDQQVTVEHVAGHSVSDQRFHTAAMTKGRSTFNGRIHIHPQAPGTRADLANRNLLLDDSAEINAKPELEIYTDDVQCSHGSTVGALDPEALFLMRSRGVPEPVARRLLIAAFLNETLSDADRDDASAAIERYLAGAAP
ncbi:MAG: SufD family Fe-S cluster assembly protein [Pseudomonadota bacterium]